MNRSECSVAAGPQRYVVPQSESAVRPPLRSAMLSLFLMLSCCASPSEPALTEGESVTDAVRLESSRPSTSLMDLAVTVATTDDIESEEKGIVRNGEILAYVPADGDLTELVLLGGDGTQRMLAFADEINDLSWLQGTELLWVSERMVGGYRFSVVDLRAATVIGSLPGGPVSYTPRAVWGSEDRRFGLFAMVDDYAVIDLSIPQVIDTVDLPLVELGFHPGGEALYVHGADGRQSFYLPDGSRIDVQGCAGFAPDGSLFSGCDGSLRFIDLGGQLINEIPVDAGRWWPVSADHWMRSQQRPVSSDGELIDSIVAGDVFSIVDWETKEEMPVDYATQPHHYCATCDFHFGLAPQQDNGVMAVVVNGAGEVLERFDEGFTMSHIPQERGISERFWLQRIPALDPPLTHAKVDLDAGTLGARFTGWPEQCDKDFLLESRTTGVELPIAWLCSADRILAPNGSDMVFVPTTTGGFTEVALPSEFDARWIETIKGGLLAHSRGSVLRIDLTGGTSSSLEARLGLFQLVQPLN